MLRLINVHRNLGPDEPINMGDRIVLHGLLYQVKENYLAAVRGSNEMIFQVLGIDPFNQAKNSESLHSELWDKMKELWGYDPSSDDGAPEWNWNDMEAAAKTIRFIQSSPAINPLDSDSLYTNTSVIGELTSYELELKDGALYVGCTRVELSDIETLLPLVKKHKEEYDAMPPSDLESE